MALLLAGTLCRLYFCTFLPLEFRQWPRDLLWPMKCERNEMCHIHVEVFMGSVWFSTCSSHARVNVVDTLPHSLLRDWCCKCWSLSYSSLPLQRIALNPGGITQSLLPEGQAAVNDQFILTSSSWDQVEASLHHSPYLCLICFPCLILFPHSPCPERTLSINHFHKNPQLRLRF